MHDRLLVARVKRGQADALRCIYEKYRDHLFVLAVALSHDVHIAEDAVHDVFVKFAEDLPAFRLTGSLKGYLAKCVVNRVRDLMRKRRTQTLNTRPDEPPASSFGSEPDQRLICNEQLQQLSKALAEVPHEQREVIALHIQGQLRFRAIASYLGLSVNTVKGRYRYGISKLRSALNGEL
jgi:RNA polymerase sigma-70 factor (ECF subfamily)